VNLTIPPEIIERCTKRIDELFNDEPSLTFERIVVAVLSEAKWEANHDTGYAEWLRLTYGQPKRSS
jgi:hypothetical protein